MKTTLAPKPHLYLFIFALWVASLIWFHPRMIELLDIATTTLGWWALLFFIVFTEIAWLYAFFNVGVILFAKIYQKRHKQHQAALPLLIGDAPAVALLYTTANDFVEKSAESCVAQDYPNFTVYLLDDSSDPAYRVRVDQFAERFPDIVRVVRRPDRKGFKAGNINYALQNIATTEPFFALADADEVLPKDFLCRLVPRLLSNNQYGFVQANHHANPDAPSTLAAAMGKGINSHWKWYHPLRNHYGFVMLLGHGAVLRRQCWEEIGGFPHLVSEDLAFALAARRLGWRGYFEEDVVCYEDFPETVRAFRVRHMKWTRGTCEFLFKEIGSLLRDRKISLVEKMDILFPTLNLPLSLLYFVFVIDANLVLTSLFGHVVPMTIALGSTDVVIPIIRLDTAFGALNGADFYTVTVLTLIAPILCFVIDMWRRPKELFVFLAKSTALYGALGPLSSFGVLMYLLTGKAIFHVTADRSSGNALQLIPRQASILPIAELRSALTRLLAGSHPDHPIVQGFEILCGIVFSWMCVRMVQVSFFGVAFGFILLPLMHHFAWDRPIIKQLTYLPFLLVMIGMLLGGLSLIGVQTTLFGYGFHF